MGDYRRLLNGRSCTIKQKAPTTTEGEIEGSNKTYQHVCLSVGRRLYIDSGAKKRSNTFSRLDRNTDELGTLDIFPQVMISDEREQPTVLTRERFCSAIQHLVR